MTLVKLCGLNTDESVIAAREAGADMLGFMFYPKSPRAISIDQAQHLASLAGDMVKVAVTVDPDDEILHTIAASGAVDMVQLHGSEAPERIAAIKQLTNLPAMKAIKVATREDMVVVSDYETVADRILFDAKAPEGMQGALPGGNALSFDWTLLEGLELSLPWMLSGGLHPGNVAEAIRRTGVTAVDTSSGIEDAPGRKNPDKIRAFVEAVRNAN